MRTAGLILAAGAGTRFGTEPKLTASLGGSPLLEHAVEAACAVRELTPVVVVLGAHAERIRSDVDFGRARTVICPDWSEGMSASLRYGVEALGNAQRVLVMLGDVPAVSEALIRRMLARPDAARAVFGSRPGHPVLLGAAQLARLAELRGDQGARELLVGAELVECGDLCDGADVDTKHDLRRLQAATAVGRPSRHTNTGQ